MRAIHAHNRSLPIYRPIGIGAANKRGSKNEARVSNAGNIKSPFNIFTSGGENDEVSCFLIMHSRAPEPRNSRLGAGIHPPGEAALLLSHFLPLFLPSLALARQTRASSNFLLSQQATFPFRHRISTSTRIFFHAASSRRCISPRCTYPFLACRRAGVILLLLLLHLDFFSFGSTRPRLPPLAFRQRSLPFPFPFSREPNFAFRRARRFSPSCLSFCVPATTSFAPRSTIFSLPFPRFFLHPSLYPSGLCLFLK